MALLNSMHKRLFFPFIFILLFSSEGKTQGYSIPGSKIDFYRILGLAFEKPGVEIAVDSFEMSRQVTLTQYKEYLNRMKIDSGEIFYKTQLPDSTIGTKEQWNKYFNSGDYDAFPVVGVSWENALNYCKWMTLKNKTTDTLSVIYRLPNLYEWLTAYQYLDSTKINNDLDQLYSDWLLDAKDESYLVEKYSFPGGGYYFHSENDPPVMKRKVVMGKSYHHGYSNLKDYMESYYADEGYRHIGFRMVIDDKPGSFRKRKTNNRNGRSVAYENPLLHYWKIEPTTE